MVEAKIENIKNMRRKASVIKQTIRELSDGKLGEETKVNQPDYPELFTAAMLCTSSIKDSVGSKNKEWSLKAKYNINEPFLTKIRLHNERNLEISKQFVVEATQLHPVTKRICDRMSQIRGITPYSIGLLISYYKSIHKAKRFGNFASYAGYAVIQDMTLSKNNWNKIKLKQAEEGIEWQGFNIKLKTRIYILVDSVLKARGFYKKEYDRIWPRLYERSINEGSSELREDGVYYIKDRKSHKTVSWAKENAKKRIGRNLLNHLYNEWRIAEGLPPENPYVKDYLGHISVVSLDEVIEYDKNVVVKNNRKSKEETE